MSHSDWFVGRPDCDQISRPNQTGQKETNKQTNIVQSFAVIAVANYRKVIMKTRWQELYTSPVLVSFPLVILLYVADSFIHLQITA